ncbi:MAG: hypothetical protein SF028_10590 [Candidatus Sumerlaeia bacterium]|nr:hypothetical protein [Candidatus Sumerlaeia bacterium]
MIQLRSAILAAAGAVCVITASVQGQISLPIIEDFDYATGALVGETYAPGSVWTIQDAGGGTNPFQVAAGSLAYGGSGVPASSGNSVPVRDNGEDVRLEFANTVVGDGNSIYYSFLVSHDGSDLGSAAGDYFFSLAVAGGDFNLRSRVFAGSDSGAIRLGIRFTTGGSTSFITGKNLAANTPAFVVGKLTQVAGADNDTTALYVFTGATAVPALEPGAPDALSTNPTAGSDIDAGVFRVILRQGSGPNQPTVRIDEIRLGATWSQVTQTLAPVESWSLM